MDAMIRTFLAIEVPADCRAQLARLEGEFAGHASMLKLVAPDLIHITVKFLGGVPESRLPAVEGGAAGAASSCHPFTLRLGRLGAFPNSRAPRVIWVGLVRDGGYEALQQLFQRLEEELAARGFQREERPFSPHVTLARTRDGAPPAERRRLGETLLRAHERHGDAGRFEVEQLVVMRSDLARSGPTYTPMAMLPLGGRR